MIVEKELTKFMYYEIKKDRDEINKQKYIEQQTFIDQLKTGEL